MAKVELITPNFNVALQNNSAMQQLDNHNKT